MPGKSVRLSTNIMCLVSFLCTFDFVKDRILDYGLLFTIQKFGYDFIKCHHLNH